MTEIQQVITYWLEKAEQDLASARDDLAGERYQNAGSASYFACFHAFAALLFKEGKTFRKHREVRAALHRDYIRTGKLEVSWGKHYDWLFENRQKADYRPLVRFDPDRVEEMIEHSSQFVNTMKQLVSAETPQL
jgi:uncharacterized protein (UPF0332 family)